MKPRITFSQTDDGTLEIFVNELGRDNLVRELQNLSKQWDHIHLGTDEDINEVRLSEIAYKETDKVFDNAKIFFRPDNWDEAHFPHVVQL